MNPDLHYMHLGKITLYLKALRLERWPRSLAIIPGFIAFFILNPHYIEAKHLSLLYLLSKLAPAFLLAFGISVINYIANEISDAPFDAFHPIKKNRPLVKRQIDEKILLFIAGILLVFSLVFARLIFPDSRIIFGLLALLAAGLIYNAPPVRVKDIPYLDALVESLNNPIRFCIGWYAVSPYAHPSPPLVLLVSWWALGNVLVVGKRVAEKKFLSDTESTAYRVSLKKAKISTLIAFMISSAVVFIITFCWFSFYSHFRTFLFSTPFLMVYLGMLIRKSTQDIEGAEDPEQFFKEPLFAFYTLFLIVIFILAYIFQ